ncbi:MULTISPECIES: glycosyltransferase [Citrobacter]|uniref:glycosyltransferase n=1 Tax=Citrobacter TaxID=544 RepID=UPI002576DFAD|nr:glycosyltransferase [Citrobacter sp. Cu231]MDM2744849.1 glycosyltransferase [Citrobacter sp. Cu231]
MSSAENFTVLMSVYSKELSVNLSQALKSIWIDQYLRPDQIVIVKDGMLGDELNDVIAYFSKLIPCLDVVSLPSNMGLAYALNEGLKYCKYPLVARMDSDDIALPMRFSEQISYLSSNKNIAVLGSQVDEYDMKMENKIGTRIVPIEHEDICRFARRRNPISHPSAVFRKDIILSVGGYPLFERAQDFALWSMILTKGYVFHNSSHVLVNMRTGDGMMNRRGFKYLRNELRLLIFQKKIGLLSYFDLFSNVIIKCTVRLAPNWIKKILYSKFR